MGSCTDLGREWTEQDEQEARRKSEQLHSGSSTSSAEQRSARNDSLVTAFKARSPINDVDMFVLNIGSYQTMVITEREALAVIEQLSKALRN